MVSVKPEPHDNSPAPIVKAGGTVPRNDERLRLSDDEKARRKARNVAIGLALGGLFLLFYVLTIARLGSNVFDRPF